MEEENECAIFNLQQLSRDSSVYLLELIPKNEGRFEYKVFQDVSQLGQYFTLMINNKKTRLYTSVNCMNSSNRALMVSIAPEMKDQMGEVIIKTEIKYTEVN